MPALTCILVIPKWQMQACWRNRVGRKILPLKQSKQLSNGRLNWWMICLNTKQRWSKITSICRQSSTTIIQVIDNEIEENNLPSNASKLTISHSRTSLFYMLPKIHKANNPGRPIVSAVSCPSSHFASFLDSMLTPIVKPLPMCVQDTSDALRIFNNFLSTG